MIKVAIVLLNWKQPKLTIQTLESLLKMKSKSFDYQILLLDNHSPDDSLKILKEKYSKNKKIRIIDTGDNLGYVGNNVGLKISLKENFDFSLLINNDVLVDPDFLEELIKESNNYHLLQPKIYFAPGYEFFKNKYSKKEIGRVIWSAGGQIDWNNIYGSNFAVDEVDNGQHDQIKTDLDFLTGCCLLINNKVLNKIGLLDEKYFMYFEDVDFCQRAKKAGFKLAYIPKSKIWHLNSGSSKSGGDLHDYFITRNRLLFALRYANLRAKFAVFRESLRFLIKPVSKWQRQGIIDFYLNKFNKGSWK